MHLVNNSVKIIRHNASTLVIHLVLPIRQMRRVLVVKEVVKTVILIACLSQYIVETHHHIQPNANGIMRTIAR
ncbi:MAG: hypothetical protein ACR2MD_02485 [Aridibacter sp.]